MPFRADQFRTVSEELIEVVVALANDRAQSGYRVRVEPEEIHLPSTPALKLVRTPTTIFVEPGGKRLSKATLENWIRYAQSCSKDTRLLYCCDGYLSPQNEKWLRERRVGLAVLEEGAILEKLVPHDLAMKLQLPPIKGLKVGLRTKLSLAYEKEQQGDWRQAFEEACKAFETDVRKYLKTHCQSGRITVLARRPITPTREEIDRMTIGGLATCFRNIVRKNQLDSRIGVTLSEINKDRITVAHNRPRETSLRANVGRHMWAIINCMKEM